MTADDGFTRYQTSLLAIFLNPQAGLAYFGSRGDIWKAQKDMGLAGLGAAITMTLIALVNWRYDDQFSAEFRESFRVKSHRPLGEARLRELIRAHKQRQRQTNTP